MASRAVANTGNFFSLSLQNPYDKHHLFRLLGCLLCFGLVCVDAVLLTFLQSSTEAASTDPKARWGMTLPSMVDGWTCTWFQLKNVLCNYADGSTDLQQYAWRELFFGAYGSLSKSSLCSASTTALIVAMVSGACSILGAFVAVGQVAVTRSKGNPEMKAQTFYAHCRNAQMIIGVCMFFVAAGPLVFYFFLRNSELTTSHAGQVREGVFVGVAAALPLGLVLFGYHIDRHVLRSKMEFECLSWNPVVDERAVYRQQLVADIDELERAKFGGLEAPSQIAQRALDAPAVKGIDKYTVRNAGAWK